MDGGFYSDFSEAKSLAFWMSTTYGQKVETTGVFGNVDYRLTDRLTLVGEVGFSHIGDLGPSDGSDLRFGRSSVYGYGVLPDSASGLSGPVR